MTVHTIFDQILIQTHLKGVDMIQSIILALQSNNRRYFWQQGV